MRLLLILLLAAAVSGQQIPVFRAGVSLVRVDVQVAEGKRLLTGLAQEDFLVRDEGVPQEVAYFGRETEPLWALLLLDVSGSMSRYLGDMAGVSRQALGALRPGDQVAVMLFSRRAALRQEFTQDLAEVSGAIGAAARERGLGSGTAINAAILEAAAHWGRTLQGHPGRRAIVILTDNQGLNYQTPDEHVVRALYEADTVLNAIVTGKAKPPAPPKPGLPVNPDFTPSDVFRLASETGGQVLRSDKAATSFPAMIEGIRTRYSLHCHAPGGPSGSFRRVQVELSPAARRRHPKAEINARAGYYVP